MLWLTENLATIIIAAALFCIVALVIRHMIKRKKEGKSSCGCGCETCTMSEHCHRDK